MKLLTLELTNFRNHTNLKLDFGGNSVLLKGPNGIGKSNILEACHIMSTAKASRVKYDSQLIQHEADVAHVVAEISKTEDPITLSLTIARNTASETTSKKVVKVNKVPKSVSKFTGTMTSVLFTPEDIEMLTGSPSNRRDYLDTLLVQSDMQYKTASTNYVKAMRQRNRLLKQIAENGYGKDQLAYWSQQLLETGKVITSKRQAVVDFFNENLQHYINKLDTKTSDITVSYAKSEYTKEKMDDETFLQKEIWNKRTLAGPHRDDFEVIRNGHTIALFGSRGQQRTLILALKLCEIDYLTQQNRSRPLLLLDDIYSELDPMHKDAIDEIIPLQQTIITTAQDAYNGLELLTL